ncbi:MAG TPA: hypothetical protein VMU39_26385 [Solirubrobacteraceae bacterium]|nr:hypothetical protein [Solirubrobacteraceae bacterium]
MTLWGFWTRWDVPFEVSVTRDRRPPHITVHRPTTLTRHDIRIHLGIRTTSPARTLLDIAARLTERQLNRAVKNALVSPYMNEHHLTDLITRHPTHPATRRLAPFTTIPAHRYRSGFEIDFPSFCKDWNLPEPLINARVAGYTVDAYFPHHNVIVELDGRAYHLNPVSFETDRDRDADTLKAGNVTVRITEQRMTQTPRQEADRLRAILDARRPR